MMQLTRCTIVFALLLAGCGRADHASDAAPSDVAQRAESAEVARIYGHLSSVERRLRSEDVSGLSTAQRETRARVLDWLAEYREARTYPHNHVAPFRTPVFVDPHGTPCAVGYLMLRSGEHALVAEISREHNLARIPDLAGDPRLSRWLDRHGITLEEAAAIQPTYGPPSPPESGGYTAATIGVGVASAALAVHNFRQAGASGREGSLWSGVVGAGLGVAHTALLMFALDDDSEVPGWAAAANAVGAFVSVAASAKLLNTPRAPIFHGASVEPLVADGPEGLALGLTLRH